MRQVNGLSSDKIEESQVLRESRAAASNNRSEGELLREFSSILDKIAVQLDNSLDLINIQVAKPAVPHRPPERREYPELQERKQKQPVESQPDDSVKPQEVEEVSQREAQEDVVTEETQKVVVHESGDEVKAQDQESEELSEEQVAEVVEAEQLEVELVEDIVPVEGAPVQQTAIPTEVVSQESAASIKSVVQETAPVQEEAVQLEPAVQQLVQQQTGQQKEQKLEHNLPRNENVEVSQQPKELEEIIRELTPQPTPKAPQANNSEGDKELAKVVRELLEADGVAQNQLQVDRGADQTILASSLLLRQATDTTLLNKIVRTEGAASTDTASAVQQVRESNSNNQFAARENAATQQAPTKSKTLTRQSSLRTLERVEQALKEAARSRDGKTISLRLDPPSLGSVRVDVSLRSGILHARVAADSAEVNALLRERAHELQRSLREMGLNVDQVSVSVRDETETSPGFESRTGGGQQADSEGSDSEGSEGDWRNEAPSNPARSKATVVEDHWVA